MHELCKLMHALCKLIDHNLLARVASQHCIYSYCLHGMCNVTFSLVSLLRDGMRFRLCNVTFMARGA